MSLPLPCGSAFGYTKAKRENPESKSRVETWRLAGSFAQYCTVLCTLAGNTCSHTGTRCISFACPLDPTSKAERKTLTFGNPRSLYTPAQAIAPWRGHTNVIVRCQQSMWSAKFQGAMGQFWQWGHYISIDRYCWAASSCPPQPSCCYWVCEA